MRGVRNLFFGLLLGVLGACSPSRAPIPAGVIPEQQQVRAEDEQYGQQVLAGLTDRYRLSRDDAYINRVRDIVARLATAAKAGGNPWNVYVFEDPNFKNAAATRGNYIFVWSGMLNSVNNDDELAGILAHEIGHVLAGHTMPDPAEEVNQIISGVLGQVAGGVVSASQPGYGILGDLSGALVKGAVEAMIVNPNQRRMELEADQVGFFLMADAGYDPAMAIEFWDRVKADPDFAGFPLQFLSTHPSSGERLNRLRELLPEAEARYRRAIGGGPASVKTREKGERTVREERVLSTRWVVDLRPVPVFSAPDEQARIIEDLPIDTVLVPLDEKDGWIRVEAPIAGYVRLSDVGRYEPRPRGRRGAK